MVLGRVRGQDGQAEGGMRKWWVVVIDVVGWRSELSDERKHAAVELTKHQQLNRTEQSSRKSDMNLSSSILLL